MPDVIHVIVTIEEPYGSTVTSPQLPGFVMARNTFDEVMRDLDEELAQAGVDPQHVVVHHQEFVLGHGGKEFVVRVAHDEHVESRLYALELVLEDIETDAPTVKNALVADEAGLIGVIAAVLSDRIRWIGEQMQPGSAFAAMVVPEQGAEDHEGYYRQFLAFDRPDGFLPTQSVEDYLDWTIGELVESSATWHTDTGEWRPPTVARAGAPAANVVLKV